MFISNINLIQASLCGLIALFHLISRRYRHIRPVKGALIIWNAAYHNDQILISYHPNIELIEKETIHEIGHVFGAKPLLKLMHGVFLKFAPRGNREA
jgi:hypothetical protein